MCVKTGKKKPEVIKRSKFDWKFKPNLLTWRAATSAAIHSPVSREGRLRRSPRVMVRDKELDYKRHA